MYVTRLYMRILLHIATLLLPFAMLVATGCTGKSAGSRDTTADSTYVDSAVSDTLETLIEETPMPKAADELFDDFFFNFAANKRLQYDRIDFPLMIDNLGTLSTMERRQWHTEHFFMRQGFFTLVAGSLKDLNGSKDTKVSHVTVEKIQLEKSRVKQYVFNRIEGLWKLQQVRTERLADNANGDFYAFYHRFANDSTFRQRSLAETVDYSGPDPEDDFSRVEGSIMPEQWAMFAPELPLGTLYNIVYGNRRPEGNTRVLVIRGVANGFEVQLTFHKTHEGYILTKLST